MATTTTYAGLEQYPGWENILSNLSGEVSDPTKKLLQQGAAERGIGGGMGAGSPVSNAGYLRTLGQTSEQLQALGQSQLSPLYQQQVSEFGQNQRLTQSLTSQENIAKLQQQGMDERQATDLAATMERLQFSENAADQRQAAELQAAMDRLTSGNANAMDIAKLQQATTLSTTAANNQAAMQRTQYSTDAETNASNQRVALQRQQLAQQASQDAAQNDLGYASLATRAYENQSQLGPQVTLPSRGYGGLTSYGNGNVSVGGGQGRINWNNSSALGASMGGGQLTGGWNTDYTSLYGSAPQNSGGTMNYYNTPVEWTTPSNQNQYMSDLEDFNDFYYM